MEKAIRLISVERGHNPREFTLLCFGGAGPLHACSLAHALGIPRVLVPAMPGALSALGILMSNVVRDYSRTVMLPFQPALLEPHFAELEAKAVLDFRQDNLQGVSTRSTELRYVGQGYELNIPAGPDMLKQFHAAHRKRYGHADENRKVEVVNVRVRMAASPEKIELPRNAPSGADCSHAVVEKKPVMFDNQWTDAPVFQRSLLSPGNCFSGPAIVHEYSATTVVPAGCNVHLDQYSNLVIDV
jgi:N-methylhydantoinase A